MSTIAEQALEDELVTIRMLYKYRKNALWVECMAEKCSYGGWVTPTYPGGNDYNKDSGQWRCGKCGGGLYVEDGLEHWKSDIVRIDRRNEYTAVVITANMEWIVYKDEIVFYHRHDDTTSFVSAYAQDARALNWLLREWVLVRPVHKA